jgi:hypothetical protein
VVVGGEIKGRQTMALLMFNVPKGTVNHVANAPRKVWGPAIPTKAACRLGLGFHTKLADLCDPNTFHLFLNEFLSFLHQIFLYSQTRDVLD